MSESPVSPLSDTRPTPGVYASGELLKRGTKAIRVDCPWRKAILSARTNSKRDPREPDETKGSTLDGEAR